MNPIVKHLVLWSIAILALLSIPFLSHAYDSSGSTLSVEICPGIFNPDPTGINTNATAKPTALVYDGETVVEDIRTTWTWNVTGVEYLEPDGTAHALTIAAITPIGSGPDVIYTGSGSSGTGTVAFTIELRNRICSVPCLIAQFDQVGKLNITYTATAQLPAATLGAPLPPATTSAPATSTKTNEEAQITRKEDGVKDYHKLDDNQSVAGKKYKDALPGQLMDLKLNWLAQGKTVASCTWDLGDHAFKNYNPSSVTSPTSVELFKNTDLTGTATSIKFYWANSGNHVVKVSATFTDGSTCQGTATFNIDKPIVKHQADIGSTQKTVRGGINVAIELFPLTNTFPSMIVAKAGGGRFPFGIVFDSKVDLPAGWTDTKNEARWGWAQVVQGDLYSITADGKTYAAKSNGVKAIDTKGTSFRYYSDVNGPSLDDSWAMGVEKYEQDTPRFPAGVATVVGVENVLHIGNETFNTWVMFKPPGTNSKWVPTQVIGWQFGGTLTKGATWLAAVLSGGHAFKADAVDTAEHPAWETNSGTKGWEEQEKSVVIVAPASALKTVGILANAGSVTLSENAPTDLNATLSTSDPSLVTVTPSVKIAKGTNGSIPFTITVTDKIAQTADVDVIIYASVPGFGKYAKTITIKMPPP